MRPEFTVIIIGIIVICACNQQGDGGKKSPSRDFQFAEYYDYYGRRDSAFYFYNRVVSSSTDSLEKGTAYFKMGLRQLEAGDFFSAQESLLSSIKTLDENDASHYGNISAAYNTLGNATLELKDYKTAIEY
ncbi:MAG TPA: hypothetical protein VFR58_18140, partial [Flavisolibacter sp.]|nr:hypothetical protein [Flavisolibacter sp.]